MDRALDVFSRAKNGLDILAETMTPPESDQSQEVKNAAEEYFGIRKRGGRLRILTKIDEKNVTYCKELMRNAELRHLDDVKGNFAISESEYISSPTSTTFQPNVMVTVIYSNARPFIEQNRVVFERFWDMATPAEERIKEVEEGVVQPKIEIMRDPHQIQRLYVDLVKQAKEEILAMLPTSNAFHRDERIGVIEALRAAASARGVKVSIITPDSLIQETLHAMNIKTEANVGRKLINHRRILEATTPNTVTVLVVDRNASLVIEQKDDSQPDFDKAIGVATYSTRDSMVLANVRFFERMWEEVELREREEVVLERERRSRKAAELLQDILAHDIRNYNQISMTSAELLRGSLDDSVKVLSKATTLIDAIIKETGPSSGLADMARRLRGDLSGNITLLTDTNTFTDSITKAIEGSSNLIDRAKKLGRIISQADIELHPVGLEDSLQTSVALIVESHPQRSINLSSSVKSEARVLADNLLEEAFTNILSNSVNYTETDEVPVEVEVEETEEAILEGKRTPCWKITFTDHGKGIPDKMKDKIFTRYLNTATGAGLGLSIVYALVVERYSGKVAITDRVKGDYARGTKVEVWLPKAP
jgi:signal transduction histidine kinase